MIHSSDGHKERIKSVMGSHQSHESWRLMSKLQRAMCSRFVRLTLASVRQLWTKKNLSWWWQKTRRMKGARKKSARQSAESLCSENSSSSRTTSTAAVLVSSRISLALSLFSPRYYIHKISPLADSGAGCKGWLFGVSDSENFPHESVEHQQLNSANAKIENSCCVCRCGLNLRLVRRRANWVSNSF